MGPEPAAAIGIIGGSGSYQMGVLENVRELTVDTPFGAPSDVIFVGRLAGRDVYFPPRHARGVGLLPTEIPHRANIYALRALGVRRLSSVGAVRARAESAANFRGQFAAAFSRVACFAAAICYFLIFP